MTKNTACEAMYVPSTCGIWIMFSLLFFQKQKSKESPSNSNKKTITHFPKLKETCIHFPQKKQTFCISSVPSLSTQRNMYPFPTKKNKYFAFHLSHPYQHHHFSDVTLSHPYQRHHFSDVRATPADARRTLGFLKE